MAVARRATRVDWQEPDQQRTWQLAQAETRQARGDQLWSTCRVQVVGDEGAGAEEAQRARRLHQSDPPHIRVTPVRQPRAPGSGLHHGPLVPQRAAEEQRRERGRQRPHEQRPAPVATHQRHHQRQAERCADDRAHQQAVGPDARRPSDVARKPELRQRRQHGLNDGNRDSQTERCREEHRGRRSDAAQSGAHADQEQPDDERAAGAHAGGKQRARHRADGEEQQWQADERGDARLAQPEIAMDQRQDRR